MQAEIDDAIRRGRKRPLYEPVAAHAVELGRADIERLIPHRDPFLLIDRIHAVGTDGIAGRRRIDPADPILRGHFPGDPIYPGVLQVEAIGQLGLCLYALHQPHSAGVRALKIHHAAFLAPVRPGRELRVLATSLAGDDYTAVCAGQLLDGDTICCVAVMEVYFVEA